MNEAPLGTLSTDKAFYAALKLHVYSTIHDSILTTLLGGRSIQLTEAVRLEVGRFTARKTNKLFVPENGSRPAFSAEFYGFTSHKVREKLVQAAEAGFVDLVGKGLRDAFTYKWKPPVKHWEVCSFLKIRKLTEADLSMNLEVNRIYHGLGYETFKSAEFLGLYEDAHGAEYGNTRWGQRKFDSLKGSFAYQQFHKSRLDKLVEHGLVLKEDKDAFTLNNAHADVYNHFDLFVHETAFHPSRDMCRVCKLDALCRAGSTQLLILGLNRAAPPTRATENGHHVAEEDE